MKNKNCGHFPCLRHRLKAIWLPIAVWLALFANIGCAVDGAQGRDPEQGIETSSEENETSSTESTHSFQSLALLGSGPSLSYIGPEAFRVSAAVFEDAFSVNAQETTPTDLMFNQDGSKMYVIGSNGNEINEYDLTTPFDVSTAVFNDTLSVAAQDFNATGLAFNDDQTKLYVIGTSGDDVNEYDLSVACDVSTAVFNDTFFIGAQDSAPSGMAFNNDGTKLYVVGTINDNINEYDLAVPYDVSTGVFNDVFSVAAQETSPQGMAFNQDGTKLYVIGIAGDDINVYELSTAYDVSSGVFTERLLVSGQDTSPQGLAFNNDGSKLFVVGNTGNDVNEYSIDVGDFDENGTNNGAIEGSQSLCIVLEGDAFQDLDGDDVLDVGSEVSIGNVPAGLTPVVILSQGDTKATLTFSGIASNHQDVDDVSGLTFDFDDSAFDTSLASDVENSGSGAPFDSGVGINFVDNERCLTYFGPDAFDIALGMHVDTLPIAAQEPNPEGMAFNNDGTRLYVVGTNGDDINEYMLSVAYDVSTGVFIDSYSVASEETAPRDIVFNDSGTKVFVIGTTGDDVNEYELANAFDLSTLVFVDAFSVSAQETTPQALVFDDTGIKMYVMGSNGDDINEYDLSVPYDVSTATFNDAFSVAAQENSPTGMAFNQDGSKLFVVGSGGDDINEYDLSSPYDVSTGVFLRSFSVRSEEATPRDLLFNPEGNTFYIVGSNGDDVNEYSIDAGNFTESIGNDGSIDTLDNICVVLEGDTFQDTDGDGLLDIGSEITITNLPAGLTPVVSLSEGDTKATLTLNGVANVHELADSVTSLDFVFDDSAFVSLNASEIKASGAGGVHSSNIGVDFFDNFNCLEYIGPNAYSVDSALFVDTLSLAAQESIPRGMTFNSDGTKLYVVGSAGDDINEYNLATPFDVSTAVFVDLFSVAAQEQNPTGLQFNPFGTKLFVIGLSGDNINEYNLATPFDVSTADFVDSFSISAQELSPTGLVFNDDGSKVYVIGTNGDDVNEYNLSTPYDVSTGVFVDSFSVAAQELNPSGLAFNNGGTELYVTGFSGDDINVYELSTAYDVSTGVFVSSFSIAAQETAPRDIAFNNDGSRLYVIGSTGDDINEYSIDPGDYPENTANDGTLDNSEPLCINLTGDSFQDVDGDDLLDVGSEVSISNVPSGLTPVLTLSENDTKITLTFTGSADDHQEIDDVTDLQFVFSDAAFVANDASDIKRSGLGGPESSNVGIDFIEACGDGVVSGGEVCDDGGTATGDGCDDTCMVEIGWTCDGGSPTVCTPICGDGLIRGAEVCDDGDLDSGDGCSDTCLVEAGFTCDGGEPTVCVGTCGDGLVAGTEACDDGDTDDGDGCDSTCNVETGFTCDNSQPSICTIQCGDGVVGGAEICDDGNINNDDGCDDTCMVEPGWNCDGMDPTTCSTICGDGITTSAEECDDANATDDDGCTACVVDPTATCDETPVGGTSVCTFPPSLAKLGTLERTKHGAAIRMELSAAYDVKDVLVEWSKAVDGPYIPEIAIPLPAIGLGTVFTQKIPSFAEFGRVVEIDSKNRRQILSAFSISTLPVSNHQSIHGQIDVPRAFPISQSQRTMVNTPASQDYHARGGMHASTTEPGIKGFRYEDMANQSGELEEVWRSRCQNSELSLQLDSGDIPYHCGESGVSFYVENADHPFDAFRSMLLKESGHGSQVESTTRESSELEASMLKTVVRQEEDHFPMTAGEPSPHEDLYFWHLLSDWAGEEEGVSFTPILDNSFSGVIVEGFASGGQARVAVYKGDVLLGNIQFTGQERSLVQLNFEKQNFEEDLRLVITEGALFVDAISWIQTEADLGDGVVEAEQTGSLLSEYGVVWDVSDEGHPIRYELADGSMTLEQGQRVLEEDIDWLTMVNGSFDEISDDAKRVLVVYPEELKESASDYQRLYQDVSMELVPLGAIFDTYAMGQSDPFSIAKAIEVRAGKWGQEPPLVVLWGDGHINYRDIGSDKNNLMPPVLSATGFGLYPNDSALATEAVVARIPVRDEVEGADYLERLRRYQETLGQRKKDRLTLVGEGDSDFQEQMEIVTKGNMPFALNEATLQHTSEFQHKAGEFHEVFYLGHAGLTHLGQTAWLAAQDFASLRAPIWIGGTCLVNAYSFPGDIESFGEALIRNGNTLLSIAPSSPKRTKENMQGLIDWSESGHEKTSRVYEKIATSSLLKREFLILGDPLLATSQDKGFTDDVPLNAKNDEKNQTPSGGCQLGDQNNLLGGMILWAFMFLGWRRRKQCS